MTGWVGVMKAVLVLFKYCYVVKRIFSPGFDTVIVLRWDIANKIINDKIIDIHNLSFKNMTRIKI